MMLLQYCLNCFFTYQQQHALFFVFFFFSQLMHGNCSCTWLCLTLFENVNFWARIGSYFCLRLKLFYFLPRNFSNEKKPLLFAYFLNSLEENSTFSMKMTKKFSTMKIMKHILIVIIIVNWDNHLFIFKNCCTRTKAVACRM